MASANRTAGSKTERGITERNGRFRAEAWDNTMQRRVYKTFSNISAARNWRRDMQVKIARGEARAAPPVTVEQAWQELDRQGARWRHPHPWRRAVQAERAPRLRAGVPRPADQAVRPREGRRAAPAHVQRYVDELVAAGLAASTIRNSVNAMRALMKYCVRTELISANPCAGLEMPAGSTARDRIAPPIEAIELLGALDRTDDRAIYATAFFAGLRRGELMSLDWSCVDLTERTIKVVRSYDPKERCYIEPKSKAGKREVGIPMLLVPYLAALDSTEGLVFPSPKGKPFSDASLADRAERDWKAAKLNGIGLHEARHTYASLMIAAGVNLKVISESMGHASITLTLDRYGHLLPGSTKVAVGLLDSFLERELAA
jgi:integrase